MKPTRPRLPLAIIISALIILTFLFGTLRTFTSAHASIFMDARSPILQALPATNTPPLTPGPTLVSTFGPSPTIEPTYTPPPVPTIAPGPVLLSADTTGIIALAILMVVIMLFGLALGSRNSRRRTGGK